MTSRWNEVWDARAVPFRTSSVLSQLLTGSGLDSGFALFTEESWIDHVRLVAETLHLETSESVFEVGCGAGAFLYELDRSGMKVSGIDRSAQLVALAGGVIPAGRFYVCDAADLDQDEPADAVLSMSVFQYFPSMEYALTVLGRMVTKSRRVVAVFDLPDLATREEALTERIRLAGGPTAYAERYEGLDHLYFDKDQVANEMAKLGLKDVRVETQHLAGFANSRFRFNAWGFV